MYTVKDLYATKNHQFMLTFETDEAEDINLELHEELIVAHHLARGTKIDDALFSWLEEAKDYGEAYRYGVYISSRRLYSIKEMRQKLERKEITQTVIDAVIERLVASDYLNDETFTEAFITSAIAMGKKSKRRIIADLQQKGIGESLIKKHEHLFETSDERALIDAEIQRLYERHAHKGYSAYELKQKVMPALFRKGFDVDLAHRRFAFFLEMKEAH